MLSYTVDFAFGVDLNSSLGFGVCVWVVLSDSVYFVISVRALFRCWGLLWVGIAQLLVCVWCGFDCVGYVCVDPLWVCRGFMLL